MIDTDKFEGHTPGPWAYCEDEVYAEGNPIIVALRAHGTKGELTSKLPHRWADFRLISAAPDLLAEVKRLREAVTQYSKKDAWYVTEVKRLREGIKRMAETHEGNSNPYLSDALMEMIEGCEKE